MYVYIFRYYSPLENTIGIIPRNQMQCRRILPALFFFLSQCLCDWACETWEQASSYIDPSIPGEERKKESVSHNTMNPFA